LNSIIILVTYLAPEEVLDMSFAWFKQLWDEVICMHKPDLEEIKNEKAHEAKIATLG
jgi:hypothetical protein